MTYFKSLKYNKAEPMRNEKVVSKEKIRSIITFSQKQLKIIKRKRHRKMNCII